MSVLKTDLLKVPLSASIVPIFIILRSLSKAKLRPNNNAITFTPTILAIATALVVNNELLFVAFICDC